MPGPTPKPASQRRRRNKPKSYGDAQPTAATAAALEAGEFNIGAEHPFVASMWAAPQQSCEPTFWSECDWQRARMESWHLNQILTGAIDLMAANWRRASSPGSMSG